MCFEVAQSTLRQILAIYENSGDTEAATAMAARIEAQIVKDNIKPHTGHKRI